METGDQQMMEERIEFGEEKEVFARERVIGRWWGE